MSKVLVGEPDNSRLLRQCPEGEVDDPFTTDCADLKVIDSVFARELIRFYRPSYCTDNVFKLLKTLTPDRGISQHELGQMRVAFLVHKDFEMQVDPPAQSIQGDLFGPETFLIGPEIHPLRPFIATEAWQYHCVLIAGDLVFDPDFNGEVGLPLDQYALQMFGDSAALMDILEVSAPDFVEAAAALGEAPSDIKIIQRLEQTLFSLSPY